MTKFNQSLQCSQRWLRNVCTEISSKILILRSTKDCLRGHWVSTVCFAVCQVKYCCSVVGQELSANLVQDLRWGRHWLDHFQIRGEFKPSSFKLHVWERSGLATNSNIFWLLLVRKLLICLECELITREYIVPVTLASWTQEGFLSWHGAL